MINIDHQDFQNPAGVPYWLAGLSVNVDETLGGWRADGEKFLCVRVELRFYLDELVHI
jgi:hypothetical protein